MKIEKYITIAIFLLLITPAYGYELVYKLNFDVYKNDTVVLNSVDAMEGAMTHFPTSGRYEIKVFSDETELFSDNFQVSFAFMADPPIIGLELNKQNVEVRVPYFLKADEIGIYYDGNEIYSIDLNEQFCDKDGSCDFGENEYNCKVDCKKGSKLWIILITIPVLALLLFLVKIISTRNKLKQENQNMISQNE